MKPTRNVKYRMVKEDSICVEGHTLYRIQALLSIKNRAELIEKGELGGYIECEDNLSTSCKDKCWIFGNAMIYDNGRVEENAAIFGESVVKGKSEVHGNAIVMGHVTITDGSVIENEAIVRTTSYLRSMAVTVSSSHISGSACVNGSNLTIQDVSFIKGDAVVYGSGIISRTLIGSNVRIGNPYDTKIACMICSENDYMVVGPIGSRNGYTTFYRLWNNNIRVICGCFSGTVEEFEKAVARRHGRSYLNPRCFNEYMSAIAMAKAHFGNWYKEVS